MNQVLATLAECRKRGLPVEVTLSYMSVMAQTIPVEDEEDDDD